MRNQKGKVTIGSFLVMLVLFYGGFVAFKIIASRATKSQLKKEITDKFGFYRGSEFTPEKGEKLIQEIMMEYGLYSAGGIDEVVEDDVESESESEYEADQESESVYQGTRITVELRSKRSKIWFRVDYVDEINLIFFKTKARYSIEDQMLNYN